MAYVTIVFQPFSSINNFHGCSFWDKAAGPVPRSSTDTKNARSFIYTTPFAFMGWYVTQGSLLFKDLVLNVQ
jgi:hypothetical protein